MTNEASKKELAFIKDYILKDKGRLNVFIKVAFDIVEKELERLKKLEKDNKELRKAVKSWNDSIPKLIQENLKLKDIISLLKLRLHVVGVDNEEDFYYIDTEYGTRYTINKMEYDLLKEVLGND